MEQLPSSSNQKNNELSVQELELCDQLARILKLLFQSVTGQPFSSIILHVLVWFFFFCFILVWLLSVSFLKQEDFAKILETLKSIISLVLLFNQTFLPKVTKFVVVMIFSGLFL